LIPLLLASALVPAAAAAQDGSVRGQRGEQERDGASNDRPQRAERPQRSEHSGDSRPAAQVNRTERPAQIELNVEHVQSAEPIRQLRHVERDQAVQPVQPLDHVRRVDHGQPARPVDRDQTSRPMERVVRIDRGSSTQPVARIRRPDRGNDGFAGNIREVGRETEVQQPGEVEVHRDGDRDGFSGLHDRIVSNGDRSDNHHRWNSDWRHEHRYDWRTYRNRYGSLYRVGRYYDPYGWGYRRFSIGFNLWPSYYGSNFWLNDPWQYRLPQAYGPYRWVRYYDDAVLVNIYTGQVVDVINNFFW
jgi:hypothetical protein